MDEKELTRAARKLALENAVGHDGKAAPGSVIGGLMAGNPELRQQAKTVQPVVQRVIAEVNALDPEAQKTELDALGGARKREVKQRHPFKTLPRFEEHDEIVLRFAPNPNGPATLGHSRGMVTLAEYKKLAKQAGKKARTVLRFDDTDPQVKPPHPPAYQWIVEDYAWLYEDEPDLVPDSEVRASDRLPEYHKVAEELVKKNAAYVCACGIDEGRAFRKQGKACPHRDSAVEEQLQGWQNMLTGDAPEGGLTLRIKTQVDHRDPALRDWVAFRVVKTPHPLVGEKYKAWPMLDFESAVEDHLQGVTHIIRGKDLMDSTRRQEFLYEHMGWTYPETLYWGRVRIDEVGSFSSSGMKKAIEQGRYTGWDDPRLPTLRAMKRRGIRPGAIRAFWVNMGLSEKDVAASMMNLYAENEKLVEQDAPRFFFVKDPVRLSFEVPADQVPKEGLVGQNPVHADHPERGIRRMEVPLKNDRVEVLLEKRDVDKAREGGRLRLKGLLNLEFTRDGDEEKLVFTGFSSEEYRATRGPVVHWLPAADAASIPATVLRPEESEQPTGLRHTGRIERGVLEAQEESVVRFERYGFVRLERIDKDGLQAVFAHE